MSLIKYITYVPIWIIISDLFRERTKFILFEKGEHVERFNFSIIIFNTCMLIYEFVMHYASLLGGIFNQFLFFSFISRNLINIVLFSLKNNNIIRNINLSLYINTLFFFLQNYFLQNPINGKQVEEKGYVYLMYVMIYFYYFIFIFLIIRDISLFKFRFICELDNQDVNDMCCICLENMKNCKINKLSCCHNIIHSDCVDSYVEYSQSKKCPLCRNDLKVLDIISID